MNGYIKLYRCIMQNWLWNDKPFSNGQAWVDLIMMANHDPNKIKTKTGFVNIERGQLHTAERSLAEKWGWSKKKVRTFLKRLEDDGMIQKVVKNSTTGRTTEGTTITLCNYCFYHDHGTTEGTSDGTTTEPPRNLNKKVKKDKNNIIGDYTKNEELKTAINDFVEMRKSIKKALTERALSMMLKELDKLANNDLQKIAIVNQSVMNNWLTVYPLKGAKPKETPKNITDWQKVNP